jgi:hypothetical protein
MEILGYFIGAWILLIALRLAWHLTGPLLLVTLAAGCLYGCAHAGQHAHSPVVNAGSV